MAVGRSYGTFGELLQGALAECGREFLVTLPIARWSVARFRPDPRADRITVRPAHKRKSLLLAERFTARYGVRGGGRLVVRSALPEGKGLASSSADLVATGRAVATALGVDPAAATLEDFLREIEPSDGVMYPGVVAYYHREVRLRQLLGDLPPVTVVAVDEGGTVDTIAYARTRAPFTGAQLAEYSRLLETLGGALRTGDLATVGLVTTRSAELNQRLLPKRTLGAMRRICAEVGGLGVVVAHSGTTVGILLDERDTAYRTRLARARYACRALAGACQVHRSLVFGPDRTHPLVEEQSR